MLNIVSILSLAHSGSTMLDMVLGTASNCVGLGQIYTVLKEDVQSIEQRFCSCQKYASECGFWSQYISRLKQDEPQTEEHRLQLLLAAFQEQFGREVIIVDSSKSMDFIQLLRSTGLVRVKAVHLIKDVRSYTVSQLNTITRKGRENNFRAINSLKAFSLFKKWYAKNNALRKFLQKDIEHLALSYEDLCLHSEAAFQRLETFCGLESGALNNSLQNTSSHIISGNRMRNFKAKTSEMRYDYRWFASKDWILPYLICKKVREYNIGNYSAASGEKFYAK